MYNTKPKTKRVLTCFTGIDGSGKTTLATNLIAFMRNNGIDAQYVWGAHNVVLIRPVVSFLRKRGNPYTCKTSDTPPKRADFIKRLVRNRLLMNAYLGLTLTEYAFQMLVKVRLPLLMGKNVVCDRYVFDTAINLAVNMRYSQGHFKSMLDAMLAWSPKPDVVFFVDLPEEVAFKRKNDIPSTDYLVKRRAFYHFFAQEYKVCRLNGFGDLALLKQSIANTMQGVCALSTSSANCCVGSLPSSVECRR